MDQNGKKKAETCHLGIMELQFAKIIWELEPIPSGELVKLCRERLRWHKSTTYTMLRRLCEKGLFVNQEGAVTALVREEEYQAMQSEQFVEETFGGSLPLFLAAFTRRKKLSSREIQELEQMIQKSREG